MTTVDGLLEYPDLIGAGVNVDSRARELFGSEKVRIEKPDSIGLIRIVDDVFRDYRDKSDYDSKNAAKGCAMCSLLNFDYDPERIRDKQLTHKYFYDNDELRKYIEDKEVPKLNMRYGEPYQQFWNKELYIDWMKGLNEKIVDPTSPTLIKLKSFLEEVLGGMIPELEKQVSEVRNYSVLLKISRDSSFSSGNNESDLIYNLSAQNSERVILDLNEYITKGFGYKYADEVFSDTFRRVAGAAGSLEIRLDELENFSFRIIIDSQLKKEREEPVDVSDADYLSNDLKKIFIAGLDCKLNDGRSDKESGKYVAMSSNFITFLWELKYFMQMGNYFHRLEREGYNLAAPEILPMKDNLMSVEHAYSFNLMRNMSRGKIVANDIEIGKDEKHIYLITGPNFNSKTTFVNMVAGFQVAFQDGWFLPCSNARISPKRGMKSFFPEVTSEDDAESRFSWEGVRSREIFRSLEDYIIVPLDEPFTSAPNVKTRKHLQGVLRDVMSRTPNVTYIITSHEHSLIDVVDDLAGGQNLKADCLVDKEGKIELLRKIVPGSSRVMNSDGLLEEIGADPESLIGYIEEGAREGRLTLG